MNYTAATVLLGILTVPTVSAAADMHAVVVVDGSMQLQMIPKPEPKAGEVRITVRATSVNPVDWKLIARQSSGNRFIPGKDVAGIIDEVAADAGPWKLGDAVMAVVPSGAYAEYAIAPVASIAAKPARMSFEEAAGIPVVGETAWRAIVTVANTQAGQRVLIQGGAGGVGSAAVQIAKARGAYVITTASPSHDKMLEDLGADEVIDYNTVRFEDKVKDVDIVLNTVDEDTATRSISVLKSGGILVSVAGQPSPDRCAAAKVRCAVTGSVTGEMLGSLSDLASRGKFHVHIDQTLPLKDAAKALDLNRQGHTGGKIILEVSR